MKKIVIVLKKPEMLILDFDEDKDIEPEDTIAERTKLNPQKKKNNKNGIKIST